MNKQRLMELAGISSNMNNPSQEPNSEIPGSEDPTGAPGVNGQDELGDNGEQSLLDKIREIASRGAEQGDEGCQEILALLDSEEGNDEGRGEEELEPNSEVY